MKSTFMMKSVFLREVALPFPPHVRNVSLSDSTISFATEQFAGNKLYFVTANKHSNVSDDGLQGVHFDRDGTIY